MSDLPSLFALRKPGDISIPPVGWVRPVLVPIGGVTRVVIVLAVDVGNTGDSLLKHCTLVRVEIGVRGVENGCGGGVLIELVLVVEGGDLE